MKSGYFTNLGKDHIGPNEHKDFEDYKRCKGLLFQQCRLGIANVDDKYFKDVFQGRHLPERRLSAFLKRQICGLRT